MADGFQIDLDQELSERLSRAAGIADMSRADFTRHILEQHLFDAADFQWSPAYDATSPSPSAVFVAEPGSREWSEVEPELRDRLTSALSRKA